MKVLALMILVLCISVVSVSSQAKEKSLEFTPQNGFSGHSEGNGKLRLFFGKQRLLRVESHGYDQADGTFRLDQTVTFEGQPSQKRFWILKTSGQNHFTGHTERCGRDCNRVYEWFSFAAKVSSQGTSDYAPNT